MRPETATAVQDALHATLAYLDVFTRDRGGSRHPPAPLRSLLERAAGLVAVDRQPVLAQDLRDGLDALGRLRAAAGAPHTEAAATVEAALLGLALEAGYRPPPVEAPAPVPPMDPL